MQNTKYQILNTKELKEFVNDFNFPDPSWDNLPVGFPYCDTNGLSLQEKHLFNAIKTMWIFDNKEKSFDRFLVIYKPVIVSTGTRFVSTAILTATSFVVVMTIISLTYYLNIRYNLGLTFLTDLFA